MIREDDGGGRFARLVASVLASDLAGVGGIRVAIVGRRERSKVGAHVRRLCPDASITRIGPKAVRNGRLHVRLASGGRFHLIVDETASANRLRRIPSLFYHLEPGGVLLLRKPPKGVRALDPTSEEAVKDRQAFAEQVAAVSTASSALGPRAGGRARTELDRFGRSVAAIAIEGPAIKIVSRAVAYTKVLEDDANEIIERKGPGFGRVLRTRPALEVAGRGSVRESAHHHSRPIERAWSTPQLSVREYSEVLSAPGQILTKGSLILPDSFRRNRAEWQDNRFLTELAPGFAAVKAAPFAEVAPGSAPRRLAGTYFYLDDEFRGHFGHLVTEMISRLWAWPEAQQAYPGVKVLMHTNRRSELLDYELEMLGVAGVSANDIEFTHDPVVVERLITATPMFSNPLYVHPDIRAIWDRIGDRLAQRGTLEQPPRGRIFISRRNVKRSCRNAQDVDRFFADLGFEILYPEEYPLGDQVRMFRAADVVAGYAGSGLFNLMFTGGPKDVIVVSSESYYAQNEYLIAGVMGHRVDVAWCRSEAPLAEDGMHVRNDPSMQARYSFDFDREGSFVRSALARLERDT